MNYDAVYGISFDVWGLALRTVVFAFLMFVLGFLVFLGFPFVKTGIKGAVKGGLAISVVALIVATISFPEHSLLRKEMLANPEYQRILGDARALDAEANKLLDRAREIRKQVKEKKKDGKRNDSVSGDSAECLLRGDRACS